MPTTHTWKGASNKFIYDPAQYQDGTAFAPGDTLVVNSGDPDVESSTGAVAALTTGTFQFVIPGSLANLTTYNLSMDAASTIAVTGPGILQWFMLGQFVSSGAIQVGSAAASGNTTVEMSPTKLATLTNQGSITVQNGSQLYLQPSTSNGAFVNAAAGTVSIGSGSALTSGSVYGYSSGNGHGNLNTTNNGVIEVTGTAGRAASADFEGSYAGSGLLSVRGAPGASAANAVAEIAGPASGIFDVASGQLRFRTTPVGGGVNFLDNNAALIIDRGAGTSYSTPGHPFGATIVGFQAGDVISLHLNAPATNFTYDPGSHLLTITDTGTQTAQFKFAGTYAQSDFQVTPADSIGIGGLTITTTSTSQAVPSFSYVDNVTGAAGTSAGQQYVGPVSTLQSQYIWAKPDGASLTTCVPNVFLQGGAGNDALTAASGSNVLDGGLGSNFVTGATGADGGTDTFFLDGTVGTTWDTIANFHPGDSATLWGFVPGRSATVWGANEGAAGHTGATIHAAFAGAGTAINGSLTFAGLSLADAQSKLSLTPGTAGGRSYLYIHYNG